MERRFTSPRWRGSLFPLLCLAAVLALAILSSKSTPDQETAGLREPRAAVVPVGAPFMEA